MKSAYAAIAALVDADIGSPVLRAVSIDDVFTHPTAPPQFIWDGYLPRGVVALMSAHGGTGKSTIALMLAVCAALGEPLFGINTVQCNTVFASLEDGAGIVRNRLASICRQLQVDPARLRDRLFVVDGTEWPELFSAGTRDAGATTATYTELCNLVKAQQAGLVIVDNASDAYCGDEIQRRQVRAFMRALVDMARPTNAAVLLLAHVDKNTSRSRKAEGGEGYSGSTAWHNSARSRLFMTRAEDGTLTLEHQKSNLGMLREPLKLTWPDGGLPMLACDRPDMSGAFANGAQGRGDDDRAIALLKMIAEFESRQQYCSPATTSKSNVYAMLCSEPAFAQLKIKPLDTKRIVNQCQRAGWIDVQDYRSVDRKPHQRWSVTAHGRAFAGLVAPSAPTAPTTDDDVPGALGANVGAPTAPTCIGGVGDERAHADTDLPVADGRRRVPVFVHTPTLSASPPA